MAYETVEPTLIPNTTMQKYINSSGVFRTYRISPIDGYVLRDNKGDWEDIDGTAYESYYTGTCSCSSTYDFTPTVLANGYTAYGSREFYARPSSEVPSSQIFGLLDPEPEIM